MRHKTVISEIIWFFIAVMLLLTSCSSGSCNSNNQNKPIQIGTLPNGSVVWSSTGNVAVSYDKPAYATISLQGDLDNESFVLYFTTSNLQTVSAKTSLNDTSSAASGLVVTPSQCTLGTAKSGLSSSCVITITSNDPKLISNTYQINSTVQEANGKTEMLSPISALVSNTLSTSSNDVTQFEINNVSGTIVNNTISVVLPYGTDITALAPTFAENGESVLINGVVQINGVTTNDFSNSVNTPVVYTVVAKNGSSQDYQVIVTTAPNTANDITTFSIDGSLGVQSGNNSFVVKMPYGVQLGNLVARFNTTGAKVQIGDIVQVNGVSINDFSTSINDPIIYTVYAADGSTRNYRIYVMNNLNSAKSILHFSLNGNDITTQINESEHTISALLPYGTDLKSLMVDFGLTGASISRNSESTPLQSGYIQDFTNPVTYTVYAADGSTQNYVITVTTALSPAKDLTAFSINGLNGVVSGNTFSVTLPYGTNLASLVANYSTTGATVKIGNATQVSGGTVNNFSSSTTKPITYTVYAADGSSQDYNIIVKNELNPNKAITSFILNGTDFTSNINQNSHTINVSLPYAPADITSLTVVFSINGDLMTLSGNTTPLKSGYKQDFTNPVTYTVHAADGSTQDYTITVALPTWRYVGNAGFSAGQSGYVSMAFKPYINQPYVAYEDYANNQAVTVMAYNGTDWTGVGPAGFNVRGNGGPITSVSLAFNPSTSQPYVAYNFSTYENIAVFDGSNWSALGGYAFGSNTGATTLTFSKIDSQPYYAYIQGIGYYTQSIGVGSYNSTLGLYVIADKIVNPTPLDNPMFTDSLTKPVIAMHPVTNQPYVAYIDSNNGYALTVKVYDGSYWVNVGNPIVSPGQAGDFSLAFNPVNNQPYVAFEDYTNNYKVSVMRFDGSNWVNVGSAGFSDGQANYVSLAFSPENNQPYVAYKDAAHGNKASVLGFNGVNWAGITGFTTGQANFISLAFNPGNNRPYIAYEDVDNGGKATVMFLSPK